MSRIGQFRARPIRPRAREVGVHGPDQFRGGAKHFIGAELVRAMGADLAQARTYWAGAKLADPAR